MIFCKIINDINEYNSDLTERLVPSPVPNQFTNYLHWSKSNNQLFLTVKI